MGPVFMPLGGRRAGFSPPQQYRFILIMMG